MPPVTKPGPHAPRRVEKQNAINKLNFARLPPGSSKFLNWTGKVWLGELHVLGQKFSTARQTELKACSDLHDQYTRWLERQPANVRAKHEEHLK